MPYRERDPLAATRRLLVDGTNLLHALSKTAGAVPAAALIGRLRGAIPASTTIDLVFDGPAEHGLRNERIAAGVVVRYSGGRTADAVILDIVEDVRLEGGADAASTLLIVTDDRELRYAAQMRGARTARSAWLFGRLDSGRLSSPSIGNPRAARPPRPTSSTASRPSTPPTGGPTAEAATDTDSTGASDAGDTDRRDSTWKPGRGATTKHGNPRRAPRRGRAGRIPP